MQIWEAEKGSKRQHRLTDDPRSGDPGGAVRCLRGWRADTVLLPPLPPWVPRLVSTVRREDCLSVHARGWG